MPAYSVLDGSGKQYVLEQRSKYYDMRPSDPLSHAITKVMEALGDLAGQDMHDGNFMYSAERDEYIITDPFCGLHTNQEHAESTATGRSRVPVPQMTEQLGINFAVNQQCWAVDHNA
jgi:hypothetical protein